MSKTSLNEMFLAKMRLAVDVLLSEHDELSDSLEAELVVLKDRLDVLELTRLQEPR